MKQQRKPTYTVKILCKVNGESTATSAAEEFAIDLLENICSDRYVSLRRLNSLTDCTVMIQNTFVTICFYHL